MKIGITGVTSLLGKHLAEAVISKGHEVYGLSRSEKESIKTLIKNPLFHFSAGDVSKYADIERAFKNVEYVFHLASVSSERKAMDDPLSCFMVNVLGTVNVLELVRRNKVKKMIFSSSGAVYKKPEYAKEGDPVPKEGYYGFTKWNAENMILIYNEKFSVPYTILRLSRLYGPFMERNPVFDMATGIKKGDKIKLYDSIGSNYDFLFVDDAVNAFITALSGKWDNNIFNISSGRGIKISELLDIFKQITGKPDMPVEVLKHNDQVDILSNDKAASFGWRPVIDIKAGIGETYRWFLKKSDTNI
ncbi:MAG: NAD-dependent epimerase/dehydratase family protein [Deltaproteobacteria bacterium]|nr:NAD-dependent epimerase/dehydratase family protein [Deltaproteobacteria bacterium]MCL5793186.1 NAD-dependent epimerase/dehydratase family protein [Deltaproteobacteria bacterium]